MRRNPIPAVIVLMMLVGILFTINDQEVAAQPSTITVGEGKMHSTIIAAYDNSTTGDTILVSNGTYSGSLKLRRSVNIIGEYQGGALIQGTEEITILVMADYVTLKDIAVEGKSGDSIPLEIRSDNVTVKGCEISSGSTGIFLNGSDDSMISGNTFNGIDISDRLKDDDDEQQGSLPVNTDPVGYWRFEEDSWSGADSVKDSSGNGHHGTVSGNAYPFTNGVRGNMAVFDGTSRLIIGTDDDLDIKEEITLSAWIKTTSTSFYQSIIDKHHHVDGSQPHSEQGYSLYLDDGNARITVYSDHKQGSAKGHTDVRDGKWHHIVGTYDGERISIYVDGELQRTNNWTEKMTASSAKLTIGERFEGWGGYMTFRGSMDEVMVIDRSLNSSDIGDIYQSYGNDGDDENKNSTTAGYWNFNKGTVASSVVSDLSIHGNSGRLMSSGSISDSGREGDSLSLSGGLSHMSIPDHESLDINGDISLSAWIRTSSSAYYQSVIDKHHHRYSGDDLTESGYSLYLDAGRARITIYSEGNSQGTAIGTTDLRDGHWHHIVGTYDGENVRIFVDGKNERTRSWNHDPTENGVRVGIGRRIEGWGGYMPFSGLIDEVRVMSMNLSISEISDLYLGSPYSCIRLEGSNGNLIMNNTASDNGAGGILLVDSDKNRIIGNYLDDNGALNIRIGRSSDSNILSGNILTTSAMKVIPAIDNGQSNNWSANGQGNYWSWWTFPDTDSDGIVDRPYSINGTSDSIDPYPLTGTNDTSLPPTILTDDVTSARVGSAYSVKYTASDPDSKGSLTWTMTTNATWLTFSNTYLNGTPSNTGSFLVTITVSDGKLSDRTDFTLTVHGNGSSTPGNGPENGTYQPDIQIAEDTVPKIISLSELFRREGISADDVDIITPEGVRVNIDDSGRISIRPDPDWFGRAEVIIRIRNRPEESVSLHLEVLPINDPPEVMNMIVKGDPLEGTDTVLRAEANDVDSGMLEYVWWLDGDETRYHGESITVRFEEAGEHLVWLKVVDEEGSETIMSYSVLVLESDLEAEDRERADDGSMNLIMAVLLAVIILAVLSVAMFSVIRKIKTERMMAAPVTKRQMDIYRDEMKGIRPPAGVRGGKLGHHGLASVSHLRSRDDMEDLKGRLDDGSISRETYDLIKDHL